MKRSIVAVVAAALLALGALADHVATLGFNHPQTASARTTSPPVSAASSAPAVAGSSTSSSLDQATEHAYAVASPSVVYIDSVGSGTGSGVIYDSNGDIVTNAHVVSGATALKVTLVDGRVFTAHLVGTDLADDLAVVRIQASALKPATFARAGSYHVAQTVLAIGSPLGLKGSVTSGLISGLNRAEQEPNGAYLPNAIQTSAPINPGNSGGALVSLDGVVVGMPTLEQTGSSNGATAQAVGFAVPSPRIMDIANQIIKTGKVQHTGRAYLGISPADPSSQSSSPFGGLGQGGFGPGDNGQGGGTQPVAGAVVQRIASGGPAARAGVQQGDTITAVDGTSISNAQDLLAILAQKKPGDTVTLKLDRGGSTISVQVHLGELPA